MDKLIEKAYQLINTPVDPNLPVPEELKDAIDYKEANAGEPVEYFNTDTSAVDDIYAADANGTITFHKITLQTPVALTFTGLQSKLETVLVDEILNSQDQSALAVKKDSIIRGMDKEEARLAMNLVLAVASQEITIASGEDLVDVITRMKNKISKFATDYILLLGADVSDALDSYDKDNADNFNYRIGAKAYLREMGINSIVKVVGEVNATPVLAATSGILIGRNSNIAKGRPIKLVRRKFSGEVARLAGAEEGAVRLVKIVENPYPVNAANANTLGYGVFGYESKVLALTNYRAVAWCDDFGL